MILYDQLSETHIARMFEAGTASKLLLCGPGLYQDLADLVGDRLETVDPSESYGLPVQRLRTEYGDLIVLALELPGVGERFGLVTQVLQRIQGSAYVPEVEG